MQREYTQTLASFLAFFRIHAAVYLDTRRKLLHHLAAAL